MDRLTIVFINGHEEKYQILQHHPVETSLQMQHFKQLIENDMLKLINIDHEQIQLIPLAQIRKIIIHPSNVTDIPEKGFNGFLPVTVEKSIFSPYDDQH
jgi:hypothetical protein